MCSNACCTTSIILALVIGIISFAINATGFFNPRTPIVHTKDGPVRGYLTTSRDGRGYAAYVGIPYASPPINELRFQPPTPAKPWNDVFEANKFAPDCYQFDSLVFGKYMGDEDCLKLNVFVPKKPNSVNLLSVIVWIHGGGFVSGGSAVYDPKYFMDKDVIVVSMNYRLGIFGFLNTGDETVRGNMGLKDQRLAMQWVQRNIANFGGDPEKVTLMGESAGAVSVHSHLISPSSKGLFSKAILQSSSIYSPWAIIRNPARQAKNFAASLGCSGSTTKKMVDCLKTKTPKELTSSMVPIMDKAPFTPPDAMWALTVETVPSKDAFFTEDPRIQLQNGNFNKVPVIMGVTSGEGGLRTARLEATNRRLDDIEQNWNTYSPQLHIYSPQRTDVSEKIRKYYFSDQPFTSDPDGFYRNFTVMVSDGWFFQGLKNAAISHIAEKSPVYLYYYDYDSSLPGVYSLMKAVNSDDWLFAEIKFAMSITKDYFKKYFGYHGHHEYGPCHADDLGQLFKLDWIMEITKKSSDYKFSKNFVNVFADFASQDGEKLKFNGKEWPMLKASNNTLLYMKLDKEGEIIHEPFTERVAFWNSLNIRNWGNKDDSW